VNLFDSDGQGKNTDDRAIIIEKKTQRMKPRERILGANLSQGSQNQGVARGKVKRWEGSVGSNRNEKRREKRGKRRGGFLTSTYEEAVKGVKKPKLEFGRGKEGRGSNGVWGRLTFKIGKEESGKKKKKRVAIKLKSLKGLRCGSKWGRHK